ncbi:response regulator transcription factor [Maliponia aquimaris]|uniref:Transcriptional regulatory protein OmpR n=1 Tax=Maliponia aquimaris TaxID=1673631 RepID=A0A238L752_9RHOB|nr:response regulator transcription factor [Maliponia aquimaris]SMX50933.1 Transcriptional regulatory protein OmpR [Maliponia aquimaris]
MSKHVLTIDDDRQITEFLQRVLSKRGSRVAAVGSGTQMGLLMAHVEFDPVIPDAGLPEIDGFRVTRGLRGASAVPIIMLTVRNAFHGTITGREVGSDDHVAQPFDPREQLARMRAALRQAESVVPVSMAWGKARQVSFSGFLLQLDTRKATARGGKEVPLNSSEYPLLTALVQKAGEVVTRTQLMDQLNSGAIHATDRAVDAHVARVRCKFALAGGRGRPDQDRARPGLLPGIRRAGRHGMTWRACSDRPRAAMRHDEAAPDRARPLTSADGM